jgi:hypothetical protein
MKLDIPECDYMEKKGSKCLSEWGDWKLTKKCSRKEDNSKGVYTRDCLYSDNLKNCPQHGFKDIKLSACPNCSHLSHKWTVKSCDNKNNEYCEEGCRLYDNNRYYKTMKLNVPECDYQEKRGNECFPYWGDWNNVHACSKTEDNSIAKFERDCIRKSKIRSCNLNPNIDDSKKDVVCINCGEKSSEWKVKLCENENNNDENDSNGNNDGDKNENYCEEGCRLYEDGKYYKTMVLDTPDCVYKEKKGEECLPYWSKWELKKNCSKTTDDSKKHYERDCIRDSDGQPCTKNKNELLNIKEESVCVNCGEKSIDWKHKCDIEEISKDNDGNCIKACELYEKGKYHNTKILDVDDCNYQEKKDVECIPKWCTVDEPDGWVEKPCEEGEENCENSCRIFEKNSNVKESWYKTMVLNKPGCDGLEKKGKLCEPEDCVISNWKWSNCDKPCNRMGTRSGTRHISFEPKYGGEKCPIELSKEESCNDHNCYKLSHVSSHGIPPTMETPINHDLPDYAFPNSYKNYRTNDIGDCLEQCLRDSTCNSVSTHRGNWMNPVLCRLGPSTNFTGYSEKSVWSFIKKWVP